MNDDNKTTKDEESNTEQDEPINSVEEDSKHLGLAGTITKNFICSPVTPMLLIATLVIGLLGLTFTPRQEDPQISVPMIDVFVQYPGAASQQVSKLVTEPLERLMSEMTGVRHVYSATERGMSMITVRFKVGEDMGESIVKIHDKIQSNMDLMPPGVNMPLVKPVSIDDVPVVTLTLWSEDVDDSILRTLSLDVMQRLGEIPSTGKSFVVGGRKDQVKVEVQPERLSGYGISLGQVANTIKTANSEINTGGIESGNTAFTVYSGSFLHTASEIERLVVGTRNGSPVYVRDIAKVSHGPEEANKSVSFYTGPAYAVSNTVADGVPAVTIAIAKKEGTNGVSVANEIVTKLDILKSELIPSNVNVEITRDYGKSANDKVNELLGAMFEAAIAVAILCLIGLGTRAAFVVISVIPVVILITVWSAWVLDYTIDRVSLFALIFSIGILVDDATVVVENIFRHWLAEGKTSVVTAIQAVREVGNPTILATFTIIAALLPMGVVSGLMGPYMMPIPVLGASAMFFSLVAAFVFTPWVAMQVRPRLAALAKAEKREQRSISIIRRFYRPFINPLVKNRTLGIIFLISVIAITLVVCSFFYYKIVTVKMLPFDNKPEFSVIVNMPEGTAMPVTANATNRLAEALRDIPEVTAVVTNAGTAQPFNFNGMVRHYYLRQRSWDGDLLVMLTDKSTRERGSHEIAVEARQILTPIATEMGAKIAIVEMPPGPPVLQTVVTEIYGPDAATRRQVATDMTQIFNDVENIVDVDNYMTDPYEYWRFEVDTEKAVRRGISVDDINNNLAMAMGNFTLGDIKRGTVLEPTFITMHVPLSARSQISTLGDLPIPSNQGSMIPLSELGSFVREYEDPVIYHKDLRPVEYVTGEMEGRLGAPIYGMYGVEDALETYVTPDGQTMTGMPMGLIGPPSNDTVSGFEWTGEWTVTYETFRDMGIAFMAAMILIYGLLVWEFKNFALAGLIMSPIPLTLIGIIPGHWITGAEFTATSMIGMIALGGIIVRQSILIVEFVKIEVAKGIPVKEAAVKAAETRMRPIFITSLTLMAGAWAIINDPIFQGMAVSLLFGAGVATVFSVIVIPLGCISATKQFYKITSEEGGTVLSHAYYDIEHKQKDTDEDEEDTTCIPIHVRLGNLLGSILWPLAHVVYLVISGIYALISKAFSSGINAISFLLTPVFKAMNRAFSKSGPAHATSPAFDANEQEDLWQSNASGYQQNDNTNQENEAEQTAASSAKPKKQKASKIEVVTEDSGHEAQEEPPIVNKLNKEETKTDESDSSSIEKSDENNKPEKKQI